MSPAPIEVHRGPTRLRVATVQMIFADSLSGNLAKIELAATRAADAGADVVLFPECATTGYAYDFGTLKPAELPRALRAVAMIAAKRHVHLLVGSPIFAGRRLYNGLVVFDRRGRLVHTYAKCQLTDADRSSFAPGNGLSLFSLDGHTRAPRRFAGGERDARSRPGRVNWSGKARELYQIVVKIAGDRLGPSWPKTTSMFGSELRRIAPQLRLHGRFISFERKGKDRVVSLKTEGASAAAGLPSSI
jgi:Carbon-nitrogen hydrolase